MAQTRIRDFGLNVGGLPTGKNNAISDVGGVLVGHSTLIFGDGELRRGQGPVRTGVTAITSTFRKYLSGKGKGCCSFIKWTQQGFWVWSRFVNWV